jgi:hypothetical protein
MPSGPLESTAAVVGRLLVTRHNYEPPSLWSFRLVVGGMTEFGTASLPRLRCGCR